MTRFLSVAVVAAGPQKHLRSVRRQGRDAFRMSKFAMKSATRARTAAKDLLEILKGLGIKSSLKQAQETVAKMLGYPAWQGLLDGLSDVVDPDDAQATPETVADRRNQQRVALLEAGVPEAMAEGVRAQLGVTARADASNLREIGELQLALRYHPHRFDDAVEGKIRFDDEVARLHGKSNLFVEDGPEGYFLEIAKLYASLENYSARRPVFERDLGLVSAGADDDLIWGCARLVLGNNTITDASEMPADVVVAHLGTRFDFRGMRNEMHYVHLGPNALPSPYFRGGIEGVYVDPPYFDVSDEEGLERDVQFGLVVSPEYITSLHYMDQTTDMFDPYRWVIENSRVAWLSVKIGKDGLLGEITALNDEEAYADFIPFAAPAIDVALTALKKRLEAVPEMIECISVDSTEEEVARFRRARTPEQRKRALAEMAEYEGDMGAITVWGGSPVDGETVPVPGPHLRQDMEDLMESIRVYAHCAEHNRAWRQVHFAKLANEAIVAFRGSDDPDADRAESWLWVNRLCMANGHLDLREYQKALDVLRPIIGQPGHHFALHAVVPTMAAAIMAGDANAVEALVKDARTMAERWKSKYPSDVSLWAELMGRCYLGQDVGDLIEAAMASNEMVAAKLSTGESRGYFEPRSFHAAGTDRSAAAIAGGFDEVWKKLNEAGLAPDLPQAAATAFN